MLKTVFSRQTTNHILMVRPSNFGFNEQTAASNAFQQNDTSLDTETIKQQAIEEFDTFVRLLKAHGINVIVVQDTPVPIKTDAVFPNNWISFHDNGTVVIYPMLSENRRLERQNPVIETLRQQFKIKKYIDFTNYESKQQFLEGTGSLILDRSNRLVYACLSPRTDDVLLDIFCNWAEYKKIAFNAYDKNDVQIYHTNVMMAMGKTFVVICMATITNKRDKAELLKRFAVTGKEVIDITFEQMEAFAGNMLQVHNDEDISYLVMSSQAYQSLTKQQIKGIEKHTQILHSPLNIIEKYGGGSARCMMAEVFLPEKE